jgi:hypothetical protein
MDVIDLKYRPREWQKAVHAGIKRFSVVIVHRRGGKTVMAVMQLIHAALTTRKKLAQFTYVAPYLKQAKRIAWKYLTAFSRMVPGVEVNSAELSVKFPNGATIYLNGADNPDALRGLYLDGAVLDEVADMRPEIWGEIIRPAVSDRKGWVLFIGTVKGHNLLSELYFKAKKDPEWYVASWDCYHTNALPPQEIESMRKSMTENQFRQEMLNDFNAAVENQLIHFDVVAAAAGKHFPLTEYEFAPKVLGVDVARYGGDRSVIFPRQGIVALEPVVFSEISNMELAGRVAKYISSWQPDAVFVDAGRGEGVIDRLLQLGFSPIGVDFGGRPGSETFANKRAEMWSAMNDWLKSGGAIPDMVDLKADLCTPQYSFANARGKFELESKDDIKSRGMPSPDLADALALTFAHPVAPRGGPGSQWSENRGKALTEYDPFA